MRASAMGESETVCKKKKVTQLEVSNIAQNVFSLAPRISKQWLIVHTDKTTHCLGCFVFHLSNSLGKKTKKYSILLLNCTVGNGEVFLLLLLRILPKQKRSDAEKQGSFLRQTTFRFFPLLHSPKSPNQP